MEMCKSKVCILVFSSEHHLLIMQTGFYSFPHSVLFKSQKPLFVAKQKLASLWLFLVLTITK